MFCDLLYMATTFKIIGKNLNRDSARLVDGKKFELMLTRRARAYSSSCSQVVTIYVPLFPRNSFSAAENRKKITKSPHF